MRPVSTGVRAGRDDDGATVTGATPARVPAAIAASLVETKGRPVALLHVGADAEAHDDGDTVEPDAALVDASVDADQTRNGRAYLTLHSSTPEPSGPGSSSSRGPRPRTRTRDRWAADRSGGFRLTTQVDVGPEGALVLPELFRRATDHLADDGDATFVEWLAAQGGDDDPVELDGRRTRFGEFVRQDGDQVSLTASPLDLVFVE